MSDLTWTNSTRKLSDLVPWTRNPRQIKDADAARLAESLDQFGQIHAIAIGPGGEIYDGHQRGNVWAACDRYGPEYEVDVRVASRPLTEAEREKLVIYLHSGATGSWDWDSLSSWDAGTLKGWGLDEGQLRGWNDDAANLALMIDAETYAPFGDTSTDRDGQGFGSPWGQVKSSENSKVIIGSIESRLPGDVIETLRQCLDTAFELNGTPVYETLEAVIVVGVRAVESRDR